MKKFVAVLTLVLATTAFAQEQKERTRPDDPVERVLTEQREAAPLLYLIPSLGTKEAADLELRILQGRRELVSEVVKLPAAVPNGASVDLLYTHPDQLKRLRAIEAEKPGSLRFISRVHGRVLTDAAFADIEAAGTELSTESAIGQAWQIVVRPSPKIFTKTDYKEPYCADHCDVALNSCLEWCDPRGDCSFCYTQYNDCWSQCPDLPDPCYEPKSESDYTVTTLYVAYPAGSTCYIWHWTDWYKQYQHATYHRVVHCDNSYTDTYTGSTYTSGYCWVNDHTSCSPSLCCGPPTPQC
ncbi:MAG TPA: hypothetical protein VJ276_12475 [Thermoanaerobaculia bacterium]|nr:hypothetical protein [Thermoanaerobaculia bacterium]